MELVKTVYKISKSFIKQLQKVKKKLKSAKFYKQIENVHNIKIQDSMLIM